MNRTMSLFDWSPEANVSPVFAPTPESAWDEMLRDYQLQVVLDAMGRLSAGVRSALIVMATGLGKTQVFLEIARRYMDANPGKGVLILAHRDELLKQPQSRWRKLYGRDMDIVAGSSERYFRNPSVPTAASVQTLYREKRQRREFPDPREIGLVIIDEAHHCVQQNKVYELILNYFDSAQIIGVTATPKRSDEIAMAQKFSENLCDLDIEWGVENGWLVNPEASHVQISADFAAVGVRCGDIIPAQVDAVMNNDPVAGEIAAMLRDQCLGQTIYFAPGVKTAMRVADLCSTMVDGIPVGVIASGVDRDSRPYVYSSGDKERRKQFNEEFGHKFNHALNYGVLTEGFDAPGTANIIPRNTLSLALYMQMIGRGTRVLPGVIEWQNGNRWERLQTPSERLSAIAASAKPHCNIFDVNGVSMRHPSLTITDVMGGKFPEDVVHEVKELVAKGGRQSKDVMQELIEAQQRKEEREAEAARLAAMRKVTVTASYVITKKSPEDIMRAIGITNIRRIPEYARDAPTRAQIDAFVQQMNGSSKRPFMTHEIAAGMSRGQLGQALQHLAKRKSAGLATPAQVAILSKYGLSPNVSKTSASATMDAIANNGWRLSPAIADRHQSLVVDIKKKAGT